MNRLIFGCGYLGRRVARLWSDAGDSVTVVTRNAERASGFKSDGLNPLIADVTDPPSLAPIGRLADLDTLLFAVGYDRQAGPSIWQVYAEGFRNVLAAAPRSLGRVIYISTTGVYGPANGEWVDEGTEPNPQRDGGRASLAAEEALRENRLSARAVVLRLAGIYGPGRIPFLKQLKAGESIAAPQAGWLNLIHVDDAANIVTLAARTENGSQLYCVSDGSPVIRGDYYNEVSRRIAAPRPTFLDPPVDSPRAARARSDKRISNRKLTAELQPDLAFPSYREGLASVLGNQNASG